MNELKLEFLKVFKAEATHKSFAPGRVNLIGEHTDYTGGYVFPVALNIGTYAFARKRNDRLLKLYSLNFKNQEVVETSLENLTFNAAHDWANYPKGVMSQLQQMGITFDQGLDVLFYGNIPNGAGLSSSASIELAMAALLNEIYQLKLDTLTLVKISKQTENDYIGVNCGIMDQFIIGMGLENHALLLNTHNLTFENVPLNLDRHQLLIINSMVKRTLSDSKYNERIEEARRADLALKNSGIAYIGELSVGSLEKVHQILQNEALYKKVKHIVTENHRTLQASRFLKEGNLIGFGQLMLESHQSLRDDFKVSIEALDHLVEASIKNGAIGARMTGAGFGGCIVSLVPEENLDELIGQVKKDYSMKFQIEPKFYVVSSGSGAKASLLKGEV